MKARIRFIGLSQSARAKVDSFMAEANKMDPNGSGASIPLIGWAKDTCKLDADFNIIERTGPRFVLGALHKSLIADELIVFSDGLELALRIPSQYDGCPNLYIDFMGGKFVNTARRSPK